MLLWRREYLARKWLASTLTFIEYICRIRRHIEQMLSPCRLNAYYICVRAKIFTSFCWSRITCSKVFSDGLRCGKLCKLCDSSCPTASNSRRRRINICRVFVWVIQNSLIYFIHLWRNQPDMCWRLTYTYFREITWLHRKLTGKSIEVSSLLIKSCTWNVVGTFSYS